MTAPQRDDPGARRGRQLAACIVAMLAIANLQYAWTLFTTPLTANMHATLAAVQLAFTFFVIAQTGLAPINAYLVDRFGARIVVSLAGVLVGAGWIGAGFARSLPALYVAYGIGGIGAGAVYGATIGLAMKWFPDRRGLCVGAVAGSYGFGTALTVLPVSHMIETSGYQSAFIIWGAIQGLLVMIAAQFLRMPPAGWLPAGWEAIKARVLRRVQQSSRDYTPREMLRSRAFYLLYLMMTLVTFSGLMVTAQLRPIGETYGFDKYILFGGITVLNLTLLLNQVLNGVARPFFGWVSDYLGRYDTMAIVFIIEAITITALPLVVHRPVWFVVFSALTFFAWGDIYSLFPAAIADIFGSKYATTNYGIQYTSKGIGSILAGPCAAWMMTASDSWLPVFWAAVVCNVTAALLAVLWLKPRVKRLVNQQEEPESPDAPDTAQESAAQTVARIAPPHRPQMPARPGDDRLLKQPPG
ncbi:MAG TPA: oxalate/formate MFS antiporter [Blastocatellia bacterium]|nr:oxalate/formate MFS antiporter [Blastocatellia bacterium]